MSPLRTRWWRCCVLPTQHPVQYCVYSLLGTKYITSNKCEHKTIHQNFIWYREYSKEENQSHLQVQTSLRALSRFVNILEPFIFFVSFCLVPQTNNFFPTWTDKVVYQTLSDLYGKFQLAVIFTINVCLDFPVQKYFTVKVRKLFNSKNILTVTVR